MTDTTFTFATLRTVLLAATSVLLGVACSAEPLGEREKLGSTSSAITSADVCRFHMIWRGDDGFLHVNEAGPAGLTCPVTPGEAHCSTKVDRVDFRFAGTTNEQRQAAIARIEVASGDPAVASTLFHGTITTVTTRDTRTGETFSEKRFMIDAVYFAPDVRVHSESYDYLFNEAGQQRGFSIGGSCRQLSFEVNLTWSGIDPSTMPREPLDDVIVTGTRTSTSWNTIDVVADQYFVHQHM